MKRKMQIQNRQGESVIYEGDAKNLCELVQRAVAEGVSLQYANLHFLKLRGANLRGADLRDVNLLGADLRGADLRKADTKNTNFITADLRDANVLHANIHDAFLFDAKLPAGVWTGDDEEYRITLVYNILHIGCVTHTLKYWLLNGQEIAKEHDAIWSDYQGIVEALYMEMGDES